VDGEEGHQRHPGPGVVRWPDGAETRISKKLLNVYTVKKAGRDVTNQTLSGREFLNYSRPVRVLLVTSRLGTGKTKNKILQCKLV
jgi:hypothetical protein